MSDLDGFSIDVGDLRRCVDRLMEELESAASAVRVREDAFWVVSRDDRYHIFDFPEKAHVRQLSESWEQLERAGGSRPPLHALVWLADILRYIGEDGVG